MGADPVLLLFPSPAGQPVKLTNAKWTNITSLQWGQVTKQGARKRGSTSKCSSSFSLTLETNSTA